MLPKISRKLTATKESRNLREAVEILEEPLSPPADNEVTIRSHYVGVNAADYLMAIGTYISPTPRPFDMGGESVGEVVAVGKDVERLEVGDHVLTLRGGFREYYNLDAEQVVHIPQATPEVVSIGVGGLTASIALDITGEMTQGETVLVTAAAGGTGTFAVQLAKIAGNRVLGTCSSAEKTELLRSIGCDRPINYREENLDAVLKEEAPKGVDIVFDGVGGEMFDTALRRLAPRGRLLCIGAISEYKTGPQPVTGIRVNMGLIGRSASIRGFWLLHYFRRYGAEHIQKLLSLMESGQLQAQVDPTEFRGVDQVCDAIEYIFDGQNAGKVVVTFV